jgi:hypothetical protein
MIDIVNIETNLNGKGGVKMTGVDPLRIDYRRGELFGGLP